MARSFHISKEHSQPHFEKNFSKLSTATGLGAEYLERGASVSVEEKLEEEDVERYWKPSVSTNQPEKG